MKNTIKILALPLIGLLLFTSCNQNKKLTKKVEEKVDKRPNVLVIVGDDMGYSDFEPFGGEIKTPYLQAMANQGVVLTNYHTAPTCSPARSMLLSGNDNHVAGLGIMAEVLDATTNLKGQPGYEGYLNSSIVPLPQLLKDNGYHTYMTGKWHLGTGEGQKPYDRGFEETYILITGGASHWSDKKPLFPSEEVEYYRNGKEIEPPKDFYSTLAYTDKMIEFIDKNKDDGKPFFGFLAYTAPHDPLHAPDEWINRQKGKYDMGYDKLREERFNTLKNRGFIGEEVTLPERMKSIPKWESLSDENKKTESRKMEVYAAMVEYMDFQIGRVINTLKENGQLDNTLVFFVSDNGANAQLMNDYPGSSDKWISKEFNNAYANLGKRGSGVATGPGWAQASMSPFRLYKSYTAEGGTRAPFIAAGYGVKAKDKVDTKSLAHIMDIAPTVLDLAGVNYPETYKGKDMKPMLGKSLVSYLSGKRPLTRTENEYLGWELFGNRAIRQGDWKILWIASPNGPNKWELYNIKNDPGETTDLSKKHPEKFEAMKKLWDEYQKRNGVIIPIYKTK